MRPATLYKGYQAKLAARETARQRMLVTAWEIEETERFLEFLDALHVDNEERLGFAQEDLNIFRKLFSERDRSDVNDDRDYLQAVYEDEMEILRVVSLQAEQFSKILGARVKKDFLQPGAKGSGSPSPEPGVSIRDNLVSADQEDNSQVSVNSAAQSAHPSLASRRIQIGLLSAPMHPQLPLLYGQQTCTAPQRTPRTISTRPLPTSHEDFAQHQQEDLAHHHQDFAQHQHQSAPYQREPAYQHEDLAHYQHQDFAPPQQDFAPPQQDFAPPQQDFAPPQQDFAPPQQDFAPPQQDFAYPQQDFASGAGSSTGYVAPSLAPSWVGDDEEFQTHSVLPPDLHHLRPMSTGEIPNSHVIHTTGPARTSKARRRATRRLPPTPRLVIPVVTPTTMTGTVAPPESIEGSAVDISPETRKQAISASKERVLSIVFSDDALVSLAADKKRIVKKVISEVRSRIPALLVATQWTANEKDVANVWCAVTKFRTAFATIIRQAVVMGYSLFPPQGCTIPPDTFRVDRIRCLVVDNNLAFMHQYTFADGALVIHSKFTNPFILHVLTKLIWCSPFRLHTFLDECPRRQIRYAIGAAGAITESALMEQGLIQLTKGRITPQMTHSTFTKIVLGLDQLSDAEKVILDDFTDSIVVCGRSQQQANDELSDFDFE
ncbi:uncharacterized protein F5891DRAFT_984514 [Suillus fuscotomentosus]|uniref:Uncharacterized protein n=1 Tax=Suillus fuscotomentosus TaxID=1912939 RepID=A0AAD4DVR5_9AGAM|nr:uncharacterized protein F5891DRAFT_984514 [Suillus fuscotomentosus]KAG1895058.1 hypothetical protein F5891DRAFT_984514 [Suillus fuscotomentosus]